MAEIKFKYGFGFGKTLDATAIINKQIIPLLSQAVNAVGQATAAKLAEEVYRAKLWSGEKDAYVKTISWKMTGDFSGHVEATYKYAEEIDNGRPAKDLKKMLNTSLKVRNGKNGRYLYIPLRQNTPGNDANAPAMPDSIYDIAKTLEASMVTGQTTRESGTGAYDINTRQVLTVPQNTYKWGEQLVTGQEGMGRYNGMYRFNTSTENSTSSVYLTFRVMSEKSKGWIVPAKAGLHLADKVATEMQPKANAAFAEAIRRTLKK